jgi:hypothetical protein
MGARWMKRIAVVAMLAMAPDVVFAGTREPGWVKKTGVGTVVEVTLTTGGTSFEAIWMGRDGDRAVFERLNPDETLSVPIRAVQTLRIVRGRSSSNAPTYASLGVASGFWGSVLVLALFFVPRK